MLNYQSGTHLVFLFQFHLAVVGYIPIYSHGWYVHIILDMPILILPYYWYHWSIFPCIAIICPKYISHMSSIFVTIFPHDYHMYFPYVPTTLPMYSNIFPNYPLVNWHNYGTSPFLMATVHISHITYFHINQSKTIIYSNSTMNYGTLIYISQVYQVIDGNFHIYIHIYLPYHIFP